MPRYQPLCLVLLASCVGIPAVAGEAEIARVKNEFPAALRKLEQHYNQVKAVCVVHHQSKGKSWAEQAVLAKQGDLMKAVSTKLDANDKRTDSEEVVICFTPSVSFNTKRPDADSPYALTDVQHPGSADAVSNYMSMYLLAPYSVCGTPFSRMMSHPSFKMGTVEPAGPDGRDLRITYQYYDKPKFLADGWIEVAPDDGWVIRKAWNGTARPARAHIVSSVDYGSSGSGGVPLPSRVTYDLPGGWHQVGNLESISFAPTPEREFLPTFYGLPDLAGLAKDPSSSSAPAWIFGLAALALCLAIGMKVMARRLDRREGMR